MSYVIYQSPMHCGLPKPLYVDAKYENAIATRDNNYVQRTTINHAY